MSDQIWNERAGAFATAIGKELGEVSDALKTLVGEASDERIELFTNEEDTPTADIKALFTGVAPAVLNKAIREHLRRKVATVTPEPVPAATSAAATYSQAGILPSVLDDTSFIAALKAGGALEVDPTTVLSAIKAGIANHQHLYDVPNLLVSTMKDFATRQGKPVGADYYKLKKLLTRRSYAEIFGAIGDQADDEGFSVSVTQADKSELLSKLDLYLWSALAGFQRDLKAWIDGWQGSANPGVMMAFLAAGMTGGGHQLPPGIMQPPDTSILRAAAESVNEQINQVFGGVGAPTARALALDAVRIKEVLQNPLLPAQLGEPNSESMLKNLNLGVTANDLRQERNVVQFALSVMQLGDPSQVSSDMEVAYLGQLYTIGQTIDFDGFAKPSRRQAGSLRQQDNWDNKK